MKKCIAHVSVVGRFGFGGDGRSPSARGGRGSRQQLVLARHPSHVLATPSYRIVLTPTHCANVLMCASYHSYVSDLILFMFLHLVTLLIRLYQVHYSCYSTRSQNDVVAAAVNK